MDFKNYCSTNTCDDYIKNKNQSFNMQDEFSKNAEQIINKYSSFSNDELMAELIKQTNERKQNGSLDAKKLDEMYKTICSVIPSEKRQNLDEIFRRLK